MNQLDIRDFAAIIADKVPPNYRANTAYESVKRLFDIISSLVGLVIALPIILVAGIAVKLDSAGPVFFSQVRVGKGGVIFRIYKIRTMLQDAESNGPQWAKENDPRVTRVGRFLRRLRIDELPQLLNVLKGEMSLVGPRPERPEFVLEFQKDIPNFVERLQVKPGLTGLAQVNGGYYLSPRQKLVYDLYYIQNRGVLFDILILLKTIKVVLTGHGAR